MRRPEILFLTSSLSPFVRGDLQMLKRDHPVREVITSGRPARGLVQRLSLGFAIFTGVLRTDLAFSWFAHNHTYLAVVMARVLGKRSLVVVGGYEVADEPEIGYGALLDPAMERKVRYIIANTDCILAVSEFSRKEILAVARPRRIETVYNGIDISVFSPKGQKEDIILTVCVISAENVVVKGLKTFISAARHLPDVRFVLCGRDPDGTLDTLRRDAPPNIEFIPSPSESELLQWYRRAKVYCQLSYRESFGVALAEAMSCECIPVVTDRGALPEVVGDVGFVVPYGDVEATAVAVSEALRSGRGEEARIRVQEEFSFEERRERIRRIIEENTT